MVKLFKMKYREPKVIKDKKIKKEAKIKFWQVFFIEGLLFFITSILAIIGAFKLNNLAKIKQIYLPTTTWQDFVFSFALVTIFVVAFILYKKGKKFKEFIYKGFFIFIVFCGGMATLNLFIPAFGSILVIGVLITFWIKSSSVLVHDILITLGLAGLASFFGLNFSPSVVVGLLLVFSVYDFIAVYKTKHMILIAKEMIDKKVVLGFIVPKKIEFFKESLKKIKVGEKFMILGGGDVILPSLLAVSVIPLGFLKATIIIIFSLLGLFFSYWLFCSQKGKKHPEPIPALPPIALLSILGYLITLFF